MTVYEGPYSQILGDFIRFCESRLENVIHQTRNIPSLQLESYNFQNTQLTQMIIQEASSSFMAQIQQNLPSLDEIRERNTAPVGTNRSDPVELRDVHNPLLSLRMAATFPAPTSATPMTNTFSQESPSLNLPQTITPGHTHPPSTPYIEDPSPASVYSQEQEHEDFTLPNIDYGQFSQIGLQEYDHIIANNDFYSADPISAYDIENSFSFVDRPADSGRGERRTS